MRRTDLIPRQLQIHRCGGRIKLEKIQNHPDVDKYALNIYTARFMFIEFSIDAYVHVSIDIFGVNIWMHSI